jgi:hypothetical protein
VTGYGLNDQDLIPRRDMTLFLHHHIQIGFEAHQASPLSNAFLELSECESSGQYVKLTTCLHLVLRLRMCEALAPLFMNLNGMVLRHRNKFHLRLFDIFVMLYI